MTRRLSILSRVSSLAITAALTAAAGAQSFQGDPTVTFGTVNIIEGAGTTDFDVQSPTAVIDWNPDDNAVGNFGAINFQPSGTTATFNSGSDFAVLNRINVADPTRIVALNGTINSLADGVPNRGSIFFYSPSGFVVGSSAVINVGSLVLTASPIAVDGSGNFLTGVNGTTVTFNQAVNPNAAINTVAGSQITASNYVAMVAPRIHHQGTIKTDVAAALVAAEAATINFSPDGLFNIQVDVGTDDANGVDIDGGVIARNSASEGIGNHYAYLVAVAKNDAVTMLVRNGGSVGFDTATSAAVEDNVVVLSGGYNLNGGSPYTTAGSAPVGVTIDNASMSSDVYGQLTGGALVTTSTGSTSFGNNLTLFAGDDITIQAINGNSLTIGGSLTANVDVFGSFSNPDAIGNTVRLRTVGNGSAISVGGDVSLSANAYGFDDSESGFVGDATGGTVILQAGSSGSIGILGNLTMNANAFGGDSFTNGTFGGNGTGGTAQILANGGNSSISVGLNTTISVEGNGGGSSECSSCNVGGGDGTGGQILIDNLGGSGNSLTFGNGDTGGDLTLDANGFGGAGDLGGGIGTGGQAQLASGDASSILIHSDLVMNAYGNGGYGFDATGGNGHGGNALITFSGAPSTITVEGQALIDASGNGAFGTARGGDGIGGFVNVQGSAGGTLTLPTLYANAGGFAGSGDLGGDGTGGRAWLQAITGATINAGDVSLFANGNGGTGYVGAGGIGTGGYTVASGDAANLTISGTLNAGASGTGGSTEGDTSPGGLGQGGQTDIFADHGGIVSLGGFVNANADGTGGGSFLLDAQSGDGHGGLVYFQASNGASLNAASDVTLTADGSGGFAGGDCNDCGGAGGSGFGGTVTVQVFGGTESFVGVDGDLDLSASGYGADGYGGNAGSGTGGNARIFLNQDGDVQVGGNLSIAAGGWGGWQSNGLTAGNGTGGTAEIGLDASNAALIVTGTSDLDATGNGGSTDGDGAVAGSALGGLARVLVNGGTASFNSDLTLHANATGGTAIGQAGFGTGGNAQSGAARLIVDGGAATIAGDLTLESISGGGDGRTGGDAIAVIGNDPRNTATSDARIVAGNGSISVEGSTTLDVHASGGWGADGGDGGDASAGFATVHGLNRNAGDGTVTLGDLLIDADATGGRGGDGTSGNAGTDAGNGGNATGGFVAVTAAAGNGHLDIGNVTVSMSAFGGDGGTGGSGDGLPGGNSGNGGNATGGFTNIGTESGNPQATGSNNGSASFTSIIAIADAFGGQGGNSTFGSINGLAGNGGDATGGLATLLVRGSTVDVGTVLLDASATGGDGGIDFSENFEGDGGTAVAGNVSVVVTNRFQFPNQRGTLTAGNIIGTAIATGGGGATGGGQWSLGGNQFLVINSDATIDSLSLTTSADGLDPDAVQTANSPIAIVNGTANIAGDFTFTTPGTVSVYADSGTLSAGVITIGADNFIHDSDPARPGPAVFGTLSANNIILTTGQDLIVDAHMVAQNGLGFTAPGLIAFQDVTSVHGPLTLDAGSTIDAGDLSAATLIAVNGGGNITLGSLDAASQQALVNSTNGSIITGAISAGTFIGLNAPNGSISSGTLNAGTSVFAQASGDIAANDINAGTSVTVDSANGSIALANLVAGTFISLDASGGIGFGDVNADDLDFSAGGSVNGGDVIAGTFAGGDAGGAVNLGDINVGLLRSGGPAEQGFAVGITSETSINVGNVAADEAIGFATLGVLSAGTLNAGTDVLTMVGGDTTIAAITTGADGRTYHGDAQMFLDAGGPDDFDPSLVFGAPVVRSGGSYNVAGAISTGQLTVGAASISTGAINANSGVLLDSAGSVTTGAIDTGLLRITAGTDITTGDIFAFDGVDMDAGGSILTGDIAAGSIDLFADGDITTGDLTTQIFALQDGFGKQFLFPGASITLESGGDISTGDIASIDGVYANAGGSIATGDIDAFDFVEAHAGTSLTTGDIDSGDFIELTAGSGAISIGDAFAGNEFIAGAGTNFSAGAIGASFIDVSAGGTANVGGAWSAGSVQVTSDDINITNSGSIGAGNITLVSTNATQTVVGDGVAGGGYQLADAEYDRLHASNISVIADAAFGAAPKMLIGDLTVDGSDGEAIHDYEFLTIDSENESVAGSIRILGDAVFSNMGLNQSVGFTTNTFELDAATGLLSLEQNPGTLGGLLFLDAAHIHVASGAILDQLAVDPRYDGYQDDLNAPAAVQRPDGVIRAASMDISFEDAGAGELNTLYVQNTGTDETEAGFLISDLDLGDDGETTLPANSIDLVINGQIVTQAGTLTGIDVRDLLVEGRDLTPFTANSTINGCLLTGDCTNAGPFPPGFTPTPGIQDEITLIDDGLLPPPPFGNEDFIDDNDDDTDDDTSPIIPPDPLFDTSELGDAGGGEGPDTGTTMRSSSGLKNDGDVDDPVSGSGNPGLMETPPPPPTNQEKQP